MKLAGGPVGEAKPGLLPGGLANCQWETPEGGFVQTVGSDSSFWAQSLPEALRAIEAAGTFDDPKKLRKLREGAKLVEAGKDLDPVRACSLFSDMLELQGRPPCTRWIVPVVPSGQDPRAVTGQMCSGGRFTSVMVAADTQLEEPLPTEPVAKALRLAHRRTLGSA